MLAEDEHAPTTIRDRAEAERVHVADSLSALEIEAATRAGRVVDLGSGAGFPGLVLAIALPAADVFLVESQSRKCVFLENMRTSAAVENAHVICARAEDWREGMGNNDMAVARALAPQAVVLEYAAPLLRVGGTLIDWRGRRAPEEERAASIAAGELGLERTEIRAVTPFAGSTDRHLHVFVKAAPTPARFPRRAGIARKRPLG